MRLFMFFLTLFFLPFLTNGQARIITGKIIDNFDLMPVLMVTVYVLDTVRLGTTDINGNFTFELPSGTKELSFTFIGMERTSIKIPNDCNKLEVIMMYASSYDFITMDEVNGLLYREFRRLKKKHREAYKKGIFTSDAPCFTYIFKRY